MEIWRVHEIERDRAKKAKTHRAPATFRFFAKLCISRSGACIRVSDRVARVWRGV